MNKIIILGVFLIVMYSMPSFCGNICAVGLDEKVIVLCKANKYDEAIERLNILIDKNPNNASLVNLRGGIFFYSLGKLKKAKDDFTKAIELNPSFVFPYTNRGWIYLLESEYDLSEKDFQEHITLDPKNCFAYFKMGMLHYFQKDYAGAIKYFDKSLEQNPSYSSAIQGKYFAIRKSGKSGKKWVNKLKSPAIKILELFKEQISPSVFLEVATKYTDSRKEIKNAIMCGVYYYLGQYWSLKGDLKKADDSFRKSIDCGHNIWSMERIFSKIELKLIKKT